MENIKKCSTCKNTYPKTREYFHANKSTKDKFNAECKNCKKQFYEKNKSVICRKRKAHYANNVTVIAERAKDFRKRNSEKIRTSKKQPNVIYKNYERSAKKRNFKFELTFEDFMIFWQCECYYCNSEIKTVGLDRVDNTQGYTLNNVVACCEICNRMKLQLSLDEFISHITKLYNNFQLKLVPTRAVSNG